MTAVRLLVKSTSAGGGTSNNNNNNNNHSPQQNKAVVVAVSVTTPKRKKALPKEAIKLQTLTPPVKVGRNSIVNIGGNDIHAIVLPNLGSSMSLTPTQFSSSSDRDRGGSTEYSTSRYYSHSFSDSEDIMEKYASLKHRQKTQQNYNDHNKSSFVHRSAKREKKSTLASMYQSPYTTISKQNHPSCIRQSFWLMLTWISFLVSIAFNFFLPEEYLGGVTSIGDYYNHYTLQIAPQTWNFINWGIVLIWQGIILTYISLIVAEYSIKIFSKYFYIGIICSHAFFVCWTYVTINKSVLGNLLLFIFIIGALLYCNIYLIHHLYIGKYDVSKKLRQFQIFSNQIHNNRNESQTPTQTQTQTGTVHSSSLNTAAIIRNAGGVRIHGTQEEEEDEHSNTNYYTAMRVNPNAITTTNANIDNYNDNDDIGIMRLDLDLDGIENFDVNAGVNANANANASADTIAQRNIQVIMNMNAKRSQSPLSVDSDHQNCNNYNNNNNNNNKFSHLVPNTPTELSLAPSFAEQYVYEAALTAGTRENKWLDIKIRDVTFRKYGGLVGIVLNGLSFWLTSAVISFWIQFGIWLKYDVHLSDTNASLISLSLLAVHFMAYEYCDLYRYPQYFMHNFSTNIVLVIEFTAMQQRHFLESRFPATYLAIVLCVVSYAMAGFKLYRTCKVCR